MEKLCDKVTKWAACRFSKLGWLYVEGYISQRYTTPVWGLFYTQWNLSLFVRGGFCIYPLTKLHPNLLLLKHHQVSLLGLWSHHHCDSSDPISTLFTHSVPPFTDLRWRVDGLKLHISFTGPEGSQQILYRMSKMGNSSSQAASVLALAPLQSWFYPEGGDVTHGCFSAGHIAAQDNNNASVEGDSVFLGDCGRPVSVGRRFV